MRLGETSAQSDWKDLIFLQCSLCSAWEKYGHLPFAATLNNMAMVTLGILAGELNYTKSITIATMCGIDTDCNSGTVGSIIGAAVSTFYIEADLPNVIEKSIIVNETTEDMNKLVIYDQADLTTNVIYYKHPDGSYDTRDEDRITPVIYGITSVAVSEGDTFADVAEDAANKQFDVDTYSNLIEITVQNEDEIVMPQTLTIGQIVNVISNGTSYSSILTGVERSNKTKLIFGTIRLDLTKIIKGGL